jgi:hypothetical protein
MIDVSLQELGCNLGALLGIVNLIEEPFWELRVIFEN